MKIRMSVSEDSIVARYHDFKNELAGSNHYGGTEAEGIAQMKQVRDAVIADFYKRSLIECSVVNICAEESNLVT